MATESIASSPVSVVSLDPAVASQITGPTTLATSQWERSRTGSSLAKGSKSNDLSSTRDHGRSKSSPNKSATARSNSLRRVKNSTEVLRDRSNQTTKRKKKRDTAADARGGRNFTIGNVGTGGVLYLRPSSNRAPPISPPFKATIPSTTPSDPPSHSQRQADNLRQLTHTDSANHGARQTSSASPKRAASGQAKRLNVPMVSPHHGRSQSFSTIEEHRKSLSNSRSKTLKIIINRPETARSKTSKEQDRQALKESLPTLHVPIPDYKIGTPRFSSHGTAFLRSSAYTHLSAAAIATGRSKRSSHQERPSTAVRSPGSKPSTKTDAEQTRTSKGSDLPPMPKSPRSRSSGSTVGTQSTLREPIRPEVFDELSAVYDSPTVVRYSQNVQEINAATPARIIAQISSESFMDYELVSDFFLTFRLYMSTASVLDHLLARLRWAIDRLEDDGRIIRVRTFAALRHWILNYFLDDFVVDRRLRIRFCSQINQMYAEVKARPGNGTSDLKVLRDLKRCWNGRCLLFWEPEDFPVDGNQESELQPGGSVQIPDIDESLVDSLDIEKPAPLQFTREKPALTSSEVGGPPVEIVTKTLHERQESADSAGPQDSIGSSGSLQPLSCSIPGVLSRTTGEFSSRPKGPHPVSVQIKRLKNSSKLFVPGQTPTNTKPNGHKRGARSIDSNREPASREAKASLHILPDNGSLVRGLVYQPSNPLVHVITSPLSPSQSLDHWYSADGKIGSSPTTAAAPGVKNIFGSLRKALGGRPGHSDMALTTVSGPLNNHSPRQQRSHIPLNVSRSHDELSKRTPPAPMKGHIRIDLLCAAVAQNYELTFPSAHQARRTSGGSGKQTWPARETEKDPDGTEGLADARSTRTAAKRARLASHTTAQSGSILIVDDTGFDMPMMSGALRSSMAQAANWQDESSGFMRVPFGLRTDVRRRESTDLPVTQRSSGVLGDGMSSPIIPLAEDMELNKMPEIAPHLKNLVANAPLVPSLNSKSVLSTDGTPTTVQNRRSDQSSSEDDDSKRSVDMTTTSVSSPMIDQENRPDAALPAHTLRRRPGGDLRKAENVHDLDHPAPHESMDTTSAQSQSQDESVLIMGDRHAPKAQSQRPGGKPKLVSMINTHSSQHLRPSFEAAVAGFSAIPDDDDGGLEATLLKLEGRYEKKSPPLEQHPLDTAEKRRSMPNLSLHSPLSADGVERYSVENLRGYVHEPTKEDDISLDNPGRFGNLAHGDQDFTPSRKSSIFGLPIDLVPGSPASYDSQPLLNRDTANIVMGKPPSAEETIPGSPSSEKRRNNNHVTDFPIAEFGLPKASPIKAQEALLRPESTDDSAQSFLLDADENLSDLSSEISVDIINYSEVMDRSFSPMIAAPGTAISGLEIPSHPLTYASVVNLGMLPENLNYTSVFSQPAQLFDNSLPEKVAQEASPPKLALPSSRISGGPAHIPFILACDSQILAQQLTLIEKSALSEIDWSDLVEMRWDTGTVNVLDWAEYLSKGDLRGIDLVITRFNLMVKWAISEIVLTQDINERAQVITKYIHIAAHARRLHNYATMLQVTIALTSSDCTRLKRTWELVSNPDKSLLKNMEVLVQPIRNFHELRQEMESADLRDGCIPFIGLYVHDLTYNAQKPTLIAGKGGGEPLINFERYRTAAVIVKGLLRLIDASSRYEFLPVEGIIERCLWLAALRDDRIRSMSKALEA